MYATCLFCQQSLGHNESIEHFLVGRRLAFDAKKGRLWAVCVSCGQWNLTPLEERWEAIEECERCFRTAVRRASTDQIGLARIPEGLDLVRIGDPLRPEFVAWRYGERLQARWRGLSRGVGGSVAGLGAIAALALAAGAPIASLAPVLGFPIVLAAIIGTFVQHGQRDDAVQRVLRVAGLRPAFWLRSEHVSFALARSAAPDGWRLHAEFPDHAIDLEGSEAYRTLGLLLPPMSTFGAPEGDVSQAVALLDAAVDPARHVSAVVDRVCRAGYAYSDLAFVPRAFRLSLEMAAHEESERRALEGELAALALAWQRAEEVAAIADNLLTPPAIDALLKRYKLRQNDTRSS